MKYDEAYLHSKDIDWFCIIGSVICHVASAGGLLTDAINEREKLLNQWLGIPLDKNDIDKRPLTKFCQDVLKQARMEYGRGKKIL